MAVFRITIPDAQAVVIPEAFAFCCGYKEKVLDGQGLEVDNPESKNAFWIRQIGEFMQTKVDAYNNAKVEEAAALAREAAQAQLTTFDVELTAEAVQ